MVERARCNICNREFKDEGGLAMHNSAVHKNAVIDEQKNKSNKLFLIFVTFFVLAVIGIIAYSSLTGASGSINGNIIEKQIDNGGNIQKINIGFKSNYYPNTITVKEGIPVEITLDSSVGGCYRSFKIPELGVSKYSSNPPDTINFTPNKKGTFRFQCSMGMGTGTIIVE